MENVNMDWTGLLEMLEPSTQNNRKKREPVTVEQRELMLDYICENPELVTHSSTKQSEAVLWKDLTEKLNILRPEKSFDFWKMYWRKWQALLDTKPQSSWMLIDYKLHKFLCRLGNGEQRLNTSNNKYQKKKQSLNDIQEELCEIEKKKKFLNIEIDQMDLEILRYKNHLKNLQKQLLEKKKIGKDLDKRKLHLNQKRMKLDNPIVALCQQNMKVDNSNSVSIDKNSKNMSNSCEDLRDIKPKKLKPLNSNENSNSFIQNVSKIEDSEYSTTAESDELFMENDIQNGL